MDTCVVCQKNYILSDPSTYEYSNGIILCKKCWLEIYNSLSWGSKRGQRIVYDYKKVSIPHKLKWSIWQRDGFRCKKCGVQKNLSIDHIKPESNGGDLSESNLQTLCRSCNSSKSIYG